LLAVAVCAAGWSAGWRGPGSLEGIDQQHHQTHLAAATAAAVDGQAGVGQAALKALISNATKPI